MNIPIDLYFNNKKVALIYSFNYETPWATGKVKFIDKTFFEKLVKVTSMNRFDLDIDELGLSDEEEEQLWEAKLTELEITWEDLKLYGRDDKWSAQPKESKVQEIYGVVFYENGFMDWRGAYR